LDSFLCQKSLTDPIFVKTSRAALDRILDASTPSLTIGTLA
jgi:hypothetical protein